MLKLDPAYVTLITGLLLPVLVGLITKAQASKRVKVVANMVLSAVAALILNSVNSEGMAVLSGDMVLTWAVQTAVSIASYITVYKPLNLNDKTAPGFGVG